MPEKKTLVSDLLHYPISLGALETAIIATPIFNRLHSVKQNSTAYLTFPSLGHSRFSHSLGAMYLSGELLYHGIINSSRDSCRNFLGTLVKILESVESGFNAAEFQSLSSTGVPELKLRSAADITERSAALIPYVPHFLSPLDQFVFLTFFRAVRLLGLVHDLGHPPFSHVTEEAILEILEVVDRKKKQPDASMTAREMACLAALSRPQHQAPEKPLHETLTVRLFEDLSTEVIESHVKHHKEPIDVIGDWLALRIARQIMLAEYLSPKQNEHEFDVRDLAVLRCLHSLVAGDLDGDRLDYVQRDLVMSGIRGREFRAGRLIELIELHDLNTSASDAACAIPRFLPNIRAMRSLEEFFSSRFDLYRNVLFHHHVVKTNALLKEVVRELALRWLSSDDGPSDSKKNLSINTGSLDDVQWLWRIFVEEKKKGTEQRNAQYLQWDDHWLMSLLRQQYLEFRLSKLSKLPCDDLVLFRRLEDLIANRRNYVSLIKRLEDFQQLDQAFISTVLSRAAISDLSRATFKHVFHIENRDASVEELPPKSSGVIRAFVKKAEEFESAPTEASACGALMYANQCLVAAGRPIDLPSDVHTALRNRFGLLDILLVVKPIKSGLNEDFSVKTAKGLGRLADFSNVPSELAQRAEKHPSCYVYVLPLEPGRDIDSAARDIKDELGRSLAEVFLQRIDVSKNDK